MPFFAFALPAAHYASSSALASGSWVKIKAGKSGMQFVSNSQLSSMGFSDPSKVNVYGFGGRMISESLNDSHPDDLPLLPSVKTASGIVFFGFDHILWEKTTGNSNYKHTMQPYAEESFYFLSDAPADGFVFPQVSLENVAGLPQADSFIERIVHEQDIFAPGISGRTLLGEDLRGNQLQLSLPLPGNIGGDAYVNMVVGSNISSAKGSLKVSSSNSSLSQGNFSIDAVNSSEQFMRSTSFRFTASKCGEELQLATSFSTSGVINLVRLDYVEVEYERALQLPSDQLYFYFNESDDVAAVLKGITSETQIWDVTAGHQPQKVSFSSEGSTARFRVEAGYHEFVAFNPSRVSTPVTVAGTVANQNLHALESPDLLIITPPEYMDASQKIANLHRETDGMTVHVLTPEQIYNEFSSGTPDLSAFRKIMKMWYDRDMELSGSQKIKYCLLMSRPTYDNKMVTAKVKEAGYPRIPIWQSPTGYTENTSYSTDDFIGMLGDNTSTLVMGREPINVAVGRFPVRSADEANKAADKLVNYVKNPEKASWRNNVMMIADDQDNGQHLEQTEKMYANMIASVKGKDYQYERLYLDNFEQKLTSVGMEYPEAKKRMLSKFEEGQALVTYIGHANPVSWTHEHLLNWGDINSFTNTRLPVLYAATCDFAKWDDDVYSGAEVMWAYEKYGVIAMICPSRSVFINMNGPLSAQFGNYALVRNADGTPTRLGDAYKDPKNAISGTDDNKLRYALLGDPAMRMPVFSYNVATTEINVDSSESSQEPESRNDSGDNSDESAELPVIQARSTPVIKGNITDHDGNIVADFNGFVYIKLFDAEKVIQTLGNDSDGKVVFYNDRKTKLFDGVTSVKDGQWEIKIYMPSEIENNFTTGRITYYALSDDGREANGSTEDFHVYGYNVNAPEDNEGPEIKSFYLNNPGFSNGDVSYKTPVVFASFFDESGINISDAGIGHALMLSLDDKTIFSDIISFYSPDIYDNRGGSIMYQLPEIEAGKHSLTLSVWDCANNSTYSTLEFNVAAVKQPDIYEIGTEIIPGADGVEFIIGSDRPLAALSCNFEVFDFNGIRIWHSSTEDRTGNDSSLRIKWDYTTTAGHRVNKGMYICRATVTSPEGKSAHKSKKIVISY